MAVLHLANMRPNLPFNRATVLAASTEGGTTMAIGNAVQRGNFVYIYDEKGRQAAAVSAGSGPNDGLKGYTSSRVNVQRGSFIYSYDEKGRQVGATSAR